MKELIKQYNHQLSDKLFKKAVENTKDWYKEELVKSNMEFLAFLEKQVK